MKEFKVKRNLEVRPYILGLPLQLFFIFFVVFIVSIFFSIGNFSFLRIFIILLADVVIYFLLKLLSGDGINQLGNDKFPDRITIDNF